MEESARIAAEEAAADGLHWTYSPMVDIVRDPRWGRVAESAGEDPYLGSMIAAAKVRDTRINHWQTPIVCWHASNILLCMVLPRLAGIITPLI